jgi:hypothetical protein
VNRAFSAGAFGVPLVLGRCPRFATANPSCGGLTVNAAPLALKQLPESVSRAIDESARLHHINRDLGNVVLTQLGSHFVLQMCWVHSSWEVQQKYHPSFVLVK